MSTYADQLLMANRKPTVVTFSAKEHPVLQQVTMAGLCVRAMSSADQKDRTKPSPDQEDRTKPHQDQAGGPCVRT